MKPLIQIEARLDHPDLVLNIVEDLVCRQAQMNLPTIHGWQVIDTSSIEAYAGGSLVQTEGKQQSTVSSFTTMFLFTCLRDTSGQFSLRWCIGLN